MATCPWQNGELEHFMIWHADNGRGWADFRGFKAWYENLDQVDRAHFAFAGWSTAYSAYRLSVDYGAPRDRWAQRMFEKPQ